MPINQRVRAGYSVNRGYTVREHVVAAGVALVLIGATALVSAVVILLGGAR